MTRPFRDRGEEKEHGAVPFLLLWVYIIQPAL